jgi:hypothetical protein
VIPNALYYECHITIEPVFDHKLEEFKELCTLHRFKAANLLMQKRKEDKPERSSKDTFCTAKSKEYQSLFCDMETMTHVLYQCGFTIWRRKIEAVLYDEKFKDLK